MENLCGPEKTHDCTSCWSFRVLCNMEVTTIFLLVSSQKVSEQTIICHRELWAHRRSGVQGEPSPAHSAIQGFSWSFSGPGGLCASMLLRAGSSSEPSQSPSQVKLEPWVTKTRKDKFHPSCSEPFLVPVATRNKPRRGHYEPATILRGST